MAVPPDLRYSKEHEWVRVEGDSATMGITDHAQEQLGDIVYVDLPKVGNVKLIDVITNDPNGPFGAKEAGQGPGDGVIAALANAIHNATGVRVTSLPISPSKILLGLEESQPGTP